MMRISIFRFNLMALFFALSAPCLAASGEVPSDKIKQAAREAINYHLKSSKLDNHTHRMGFASQSEIDNAELGEEFRIFTTDNNKLLDESFPQDLQSLVIPRSQWIYLVVSEGKARGLVSVNSADEKWSASSVRNSGLAKELSGIMAAWPASAGYQYRFVKVFMTDVVFIEISKEGKVFGVIPLSALMNKTGRAAGEFKKDDLLDPQEFLSQLRLKVRRNVEANKTGGILTDEIRQAAKEGIKVFLEGRQIDQGFRRLGFETQADIDNAVLGEAFQEYTIPSEKLLDEYHPQDLQSLATSKGEWKFLVMNGNKANSVLSVHFVDGIWKPGGIGPLIIAKEISGLRASWPASNGYSFRYISVRTGSSDFIELSQSGKVIGLFDLGSLMRNKERKPGVFKSEDLLDVEKVISDMRPAVKRNIEMWQQMKRE